MSIVKKRLTLAALTTLSIFFLALRTMAADGGTGKPQDEGISLIEAVRIAVNNNPAIKLNEQDIFEAAGKLKEVGGEFEPRAIYSISRSKTRNPIEPSDAQNFIDGRDTVDASEYSAHFSKKDRSGKIFSLSVSGTQNLESLKNAPTEDNRATVNLGVQIPLKKGAGKTAVNEENAVARRLDAAKAAFGAQFSLSISRLVCLYWDYVTAVKWLETLDDGHKKAARLMAVVNRKIAEKKISPDELKRIQGYMSELESTTAKARYSLAESRNKLGIAMGLEKEEFNRIPLPSDDYPKFDEKTFQRICDDTGELIHIAYRCRADLLSAQNTIAEKKFRVAKAGNDLKPEVNLNLSVGYSGYESGSGTKRIFSALDGNVPGASVSASIVCYDSPRRTTAKGVLTQREADYNRAVIKENNLKKEIRSAVITAANAMKDSISAYGKMAESVKSYDAAFEFEMKKYAEGKTTALDALESGRRLLVASFDELELKNTIAQSIIKLRYELGVIIRDYNDDLTLSSNELTTLDNLGDGDGQK